MAVESQQQLSYFLQKIFHIEPSKNPTINYKPVNPNQHFPKIEYYSPNLTDKPPYLLINSQKSSLPYLSSFPDLAMDDPVRMAKSVVAGSLVQRHQNMTFFDPITSDILLDYLKEDYLISSIEKDYLLKVGGGENASSDERMIMGINTILGLIEEETAAVSCELLHNLNGKGKHRVEVRSIKPDGLYPEILPRPRLMLQDLMVSVEDIANEKRRQKEIHKLLTESVNWCPPPTKPTITIGGVRTGARVSRYRCIRRVRPRIKKVESILQHIALQRCHAHVNDPFSEVHPTLHLPAPQLAGLFASSEAPPAVSTAPQTSSSSSSSSSSRSSLSATSICTPTGSAVASGSSPGNSSVLH